MTNEEVIVETYGKLLEELEDGSALVEIDGEEVIIPHNEWWFCL